MGYGNLSEQAASQLGPPAHVRTSSSVSGTSAEFIGLILVSGTLPTVLRDLLCVLHPGWRVFNQSNFRVTLVTDLLVVVLPVQLIVTIFNNQSPHILLVTCAIIVLLFIQTLLKKSSRQAMMSLKLLDVPMKNDNGTPCVAYFRAFTNIITAFCILAVDFSRLFPPYFCKSRIYGTTLMDGGLGFFMVSNAIVSPQARGRVQTERLSTSLVRICKETFPLIVLGVLRYRINRLVNYSVSYLEYGVHWNFFFTLAVVKMASSLLFRLTPERLWFYLGPAIILGYQYILSTTRLRFFILFGSHGDASRVGLIDSNREGLTSSVGHLAVYMIGVQVGKLIMTQRNTIREWCLATTQMTIICLSSYVLLQWSWSNVQEPSRRFANLAYVLFIIFATTLQLVYRLISDIVITFIRHLKSSDTLIDDINQNEIVDHSCALLHAVNYNGLLYFVVANLLTGVVNLTISPRTFGQPAAFCVLSCYMAVLSYLTMYLYDKKLSLKKGIGNYFK